MDCWRPLPLFIGTNELARILFQMIICLTGKTWLGVHHELTSQVRLDFEPNNAGNEEVLVLKV